MLCMLEHHVRISAASCRELDEHLAFIQKRFREIRCRYTSRKMEFQWKSQLTARRRQQRSFFHPSHAFTTQYQEPLKQKIASQDSKQAVARSSFHSPRVHI